MMSGKPQLQPVCANKADIRQRKPSTHGFTPYYRGPRRSDPECSAVALQVRSLNTASGTCAFVDPHDSCSSVCYAATGVVLAGLGRPLSRVIRADLKTPPQRRRSAAALIRRQPRDRPVADPDSSRRSHNQSRRRTVRSAAEEVFFHAAKREARAGRNRSGDRDGVAIFGAGSL